MIDQEYSAAKTTIVIKNMLNSIIKRDKITVVIVPEELSGEIESAQITYEQIKDKLNANDLNPVRILAIELNELLSSDKNNQARLKNLYKYIFSNKKEYFENALNPRNSGYKNSVEFCGSIYKFLIKFQVDPLQNAPKSWEQIAGNGNIMFSKKYHTILCLLSLNAQIEKQLPFTIKKTKTFSFKDTILFLIQFFCFFIIKECNNDKKLNGDQLLYELRSINILLEQEASNTILAARSEEQQLNYDLAIGSML